MKKKYSKPQFEVHEMERMQLLASSEVDVDMNGTTQPE